MLGLLMVPAPLLTFVPSRYLYLLLGCKQAQSN